MPFIRLARRSVLVAALALAAGSGAALAADKPLRVILPIGAGSGVDGIVRAVGPSLTKALGGQPVVIENLPGAGGITGTTAIVQAAARRLDHRRGLEQPRGQPERLQEAALRQPEGHHADLDRRRDAVRARRQPDQDPGEERQGAAGAAQGQAGRLQLRLLGQRHHHPPGRRDVRRRRRRQGDAHPVQGHRADGRRPDRRPGRPRRGRAAGRAGAPQERRAARHRHHGQVARAPRCPTCRRSPSRAFPMSTSPAGSRWSGRPSCRRPR